MDERDEFLIQEYVDGALDEAQRVEVEALLTGSAEAQAFLADLQALNAQFSKMADVPLATDLSLQIGQQLEVQAAPASTSTIWVRVMLLVQLVITAVLVWQLWPRMVDWLANGRLALTSIFAEIQLPTFTFAGWETAVFEQTNQLIPSINLPPQQWALIMLIVSIIWLAGNRLLFTNNNGGSHG